jgi:hypothetical protein
VVVILCNLMGSEACIHNPGMCASMTVACIHEMGGFVLCQM